MRAYAPFFEWPARGRKELGVVEELVLALNRSAGLSLHSPTEFFPDPPDCVCLDAAGNAIAVEVTEIGCEESVRRNAQGEMVYRVWRSGELRGEVSRALTAKDRKVFHGGPYHSVIACLFTDEPALSVTDAAAELGGEMFGPFAQLTDAYLLFSYQPTTKSYPTIPLGMRQ